MMVEAKRREGLAIDIQTSKHSVVSDVTPELGGKDLGLSPHELLEAALGACTSITVQMYADRKGWKLASCDASVKFVREDKEEIVIERNIALRGELDETQRKRLFEIAEKCPIHQVLTRGARVVSRLKDE